MPRKTTSRPRTAATDRPKSTTAPRVVASPAPTESRPSEDEVRKLAYFKWEQAGCPDGDGCEFWLAAENALMAAGQAK